MSNNDTQGFATTRRAVLAGGAALVLGGAAARAVTAQTAGVGLDATGVEAPAAPTDDHDVIVFSTGAAPDLDERRQAWTKAVADKLGVTPDRLQQAIQDATRDVGFAPPLLGPLPAVGAPGAFGLKIESPLAVAAKALGMSEDQLRKEQSGGKSLADVARAHNVDPKVVADALKAQRRADVDRAVAAGALPRTIAERITSHIDDEVDHLLQLAPTGADGLFTIRLEQSVSTSKDP
jgi:hypothetical protein